MKKIMTSVQREKKSRRNQLIIGVILAFLMIASTVGFALENSMRSTNGGKSVIYKGITFTKDDLGSDWIFQFGSNVFTTKNNPDDAKGISFSTNFSLANYQDKPLYIIGKGDAIYEMSRNLQPIVARVQDACLSKEDCPENYPIKKCSEDNIIIVKEPSDGREYLYQEENCLYIIANSKNQFLYADKLLFSILGI